MRLQALIFCAPHHRTEKDGFEFTAVVGEMAMRLAEDRNDLRHLETEPAVLVGERRAMALRLVFLPFRRVRPNLNALAAERCAVAGASHGAAHPEAAFADPIDDGRALAVIVRPARHRPGRCDTLRESGRQEPGNAGCQDGAAGGKKVATAEYQGRHVSSSLRRCCCSADQTARSRYARTLA